MESIFLNAFHTFGDSDGGHPTTAIESILPDCCYGEIYNSLEITLLP